MGVPRIDRQAAHFNVLNAGHTSGIKTHGYVSVDARLSILHGAVGRLKGKAKT